MLNVIRRIRQYLRLIAILAWILFMYGVRLLTKTLRPFSRTLDQRCRRSLFRFWGKGACAIMGIRVEVRGKPPKAPFFMVSNHLSCFDVAVLTSQLGCVFISRSDVGGWPVIGYIIRDMNTILIDRDQRKDTLRVNEQITQTLEDGYGIVMFAESKVSQDATVHPFKPALFDPPARMKLPVHYASMHYKTPEGYPPASEIAVWRDPVTFLGHFLNVTGLPHYNAILTFGQAPIANTDRKVLAEELCQAVRAQFIPLE